MSLADLVLLTANNKTDSGLRLIGNFSLPDLCKYVFKSAMYHGRQEIIKASLAVIKQYSFKKAKS